MVDWILLTGILGRSKEAVMRFGQLVHHWRVRGGDLSEKKMDYLCALIGRTWRSDTELGHPGPVGTIEFELSSNYMRRGD